MSVVVPTHRRPELVLRAVRSALAQTMSDLEVVVVVDGADAETAAALATVRDERVRVEQLARAAGPGAARNAGVRASRAEVVAFLDDDDEWHPQKLEQQLPLVEVSGSPTVVACKVAARSAGRADRIWPRRLPEPGEPLGDYLLARRSLRWGETLVQTSTIVTAKSLLARMPFREDLPRHEDYDWLLRVSRGGAALVFAQPGRPLAVWHVDEDRERASRRSQPHDSIAWIRSVRPLVSRRAYAAFLLAWVVPSARARDRLVLLPRLLWESMRLGRPTAVDLLIAFGAIIVPADARR